MAYYQRAYRVRTNVTVGLNADTDWAAAENTPADVDMEIPFRVRFAVEEEGSTQAGETFKFQYRYDSGGGFGSWTDLIADDTGNPGADVDIINLVGSTVFAAEAYTHSDATSHVLAFTGSDSFVAGDGIEGVNSTPAWPAGDLGYTEYEAMFLVHRFYGAAYAEVGIGDDFEFRMVESDGTPFTGYTETPSINVTRPDYLLGGTYIESPNKAVVVDANGNLYTVMETSEDSGLPMMMKSADDGVTWESMDTANGPGAASSDWESAELVIDNTNHRIHLVSLGTGNNCYYHQYRTSAHATPDDWIVTNELVAAVTRLEQVCSIVHRPTTSDIIVFYGSGTTPQLNYWKSRNNDGESAGTWDASGTAVDNNGVNQYGLGTVLGENNVTHIFYSDGVGGTTITIFHETLSGADPPTLSGSPDTIVTGLDDSADERWPMAPPVYYDDAGVEVVMVPYMNTSHYPVTRSLRDGALQTAQVVDSTAILADGNFSRQPQMDLAAFGTTAYCLFVETPELLVGTPLWLNTNEDEAGWGTPESQWAKDTNRAGFMAVRGVIYNDGVDDIYGYIVDHGFFDGGGSGCLFYNSYTLPSSGTVETVIRPISDTAGTGWDSAPTASQSLYAQVDEETPSDTDYIYATDPNP